jgi:hypothetical protein
MSAWSAEPLRVNPVGDRHGVKLDPRQIARQLLEQRVVVNRLEAEGRASQGRFSTGEKPGEGFKLVGCTDGEVVDAEFQ